MPRFRVSIATLLVLVAVVAFWVASLRSATSWWTSLSSTVTLGALLTGVLGAVFLKGPDRGFWAGFALFGVVYLVLVNWDWIGAQFGRDLTSGLSGWAEALFPSEPTTAAATTVTNLDYFERVQNRTIMLGNFVQIGRQMFDLVFACVGGMIGRAMALRAREPDQSPR
jgi:hypothetical protein